jgi:hypothetical protein
MTHAHLDRETEILSQQFQVGTGPTRQNDDDDRDIYRR